MNERSFSRVGAVAERSIDGVTVRRVSRPVDPPLISGTHHIASIDLNVVEIRAGDETGVGYTYAFSRREADAVTPLVLHLAQELIGQEASAVRAHEATMWRRINFVGRAGPPVMALSAIDVALWDLHARCLGVPLHRLLGLPGTAQPVYAAGGSRSLTLDELVAEAAGFRDLGYAGFKMRIGSPDWREDVRRVAAVREALGPDLALMVDANQAWDVGTALRAAEALGPLELAWFEEPVDGESFTTMAQVRAGAPMSIAAGETVYGTAPFQRMIDAGAIDVLQPDLMRCGGITGYLEVAALGERAGLPVAPHLFSEIAPHLATASGAPMLVEHLAGWFDGVFDGAPVPNDGTIAPGAAPGLGLTLSDEILAHHVSVAHKL